MKMQESNYHEDNNNPTMEFQTNRSTTLVPNEASL